MNKFGYIINNYFYHYHLIYAMFNLNAGESWYISQ